MDRVLGGWTLGSLMKPVLAREAGSHPTQGPYSPRRKGHLWGVPRRTALLMPTHREPVAPEARRPGPDRTRQGAPRPRGLSPAPSQCGKEKQPAPPEAPGTRHRSSVQAAMLLLNGLLMRRLPD